MRKRLGIALFLWLGVFAGTSRGDQVALMGPQSYLRTAGGPNSYSTTFLAIPGAGTLLIEKGNPDDHGRVVAQIFVNGREVVGWSDLGAPYSSKAVPVSLNRNNVVSIELRGTPDASIVVTVTEEIACTALDQCHVAGTWDRALGQCSNPPATNGTACGDGNACTRTDTCQSGACVGANPVVCSALDQCHTAGVCDPATGACSNPAAPDGGSCNDGNACTQTDSCQSGVCAGANPIVCTAMDQCHTAGVCSPATGACSNPGALDGTACTDGNACTGNDTCQMGACAGGGAISCDDNNACTSDSCDPATGCLHTDRRTPISMSPTVTRYSLTSPEGRVSLAEDSACNDWSGWYVQGNEPETNYCGPTAGMNLLQWYDAPSTYAHLGSDMRTNDWMGTLDKLGECACICNMGCPFCTCPDLAVCGPVCYALFDHFLDVGTLPEDMAKTLANHVPAGYQPGMSQGNPGLPAFEALLREGNPIVVLIYGDPSLHWTVITGTYDVNGTTWLRFANNNDLSWNTFVSEWRFDGLNSIQRTVLSSKGIEPYTWVRYEKTTMLTAGQWLMKGQENAIYSQDGRFMFFLDTASHLVLYPTPLVLGTALWHSGNAVTNEAVWVVMQNDGNLVIYGPDSHALWDSNTHGHPGAYLAVQNDGNVVIYAADHRTPLWSTHTCCH